MRMKDKAEAGQFAAHVIAFNYQHKAPVSVF
jgi:hypothetical protein